jgi:hypothetical protein
VLCDGGELWSGSAVQLRSWSVSERKEEGTGEKGEERGEEEERCVVFAGELIEFFCCVEAEQQEQE